MSQQFWMMIMFGVVIAGLSCFGLLSKENDDCIPAIYTEHHWLASVLNPMDAILKWILGPTRSYQLGNITDFLLCLVGLFVGLLLIALSFWLEFS